MYIERVKLNNFRNIGDLELELSRGVNILCGMNAQGKTNFLESIYYGSSGRSHRTNYDRDLVAFSQNDAHIQLIVNRGQYNRRIDVHIKKEGARGFALDGIPLKKLGDLLGELLTVIFSPEDLNLVKAGPSERRRFMDTEICQLSPIYYYELQQYHRALRQRNALLKEIKKNPQHGETIFVWNEQLALHGGRVIQFRKEFVENISQLAAEIHARLTSEGEKLKISYNPHALPQELLPRLNKSLERDIIIGSTGIGPHKDDINFMINDTDARLFGSQGQQRTAALTLKLAEIELIKHEKNQVPVLLLDDVLSELDRRRQNCLLDSISGLQTIITCTGMDEVIKNFLSDKQITLFNVEGGKITQEY